MSKRVLVADHSPGIRKALCRLFEAEEDYDICAEAEDVLQIFKPFPLSAARYQRQPA